MKRLQIITLLILGLGFISLLSPSGRSSFHSDYELRFICSLSFDALEIVLAPDIKNQKREKEIAETVNSGTLIYDPDFKIPKCSDCSKFSRNISESLKIPAISFVRENDLNKLTPPRAPPLSS